MSPVVDSTRSPTRASAYRLGSVGGARAYPVTRAPNECNSRHSQLPLKPVWSVMKTRLSRQKSGLTFAPFACCRRPSALLLSSYPSIGRGRRENELAAMESFGKATVGAAFEPAQAHDRKQILGPEPRLFSLRAKRLHDRFHLLPRQLGGQGHVGVRRGEVAVVLRDLVLPDGMVPEGLPGDLAQQCVVLMPVGAVMREHPVRIDGGSEVFEMRLHLLEMGGQVAVRQVVHADLAARRPRNESLRRPQGFAAALRVRSQHQPVHTQAWVVLLERQKGAATTNLDVVAVRADAQDIQALAGTRRD